jgi:glycosyltransferase involved in cell wall biosynthesis
MDPVTNTPIELSIVMPCLNEAGTVGVCVQKALKFITDNGIIGEIIVADNGSSDNSIEIAKGAGAKVVNVPEHGYGAALMGGVNEARGVYVIMADSDDSYDFLNIMQFLEKLREGYDLVMGNRFTEAIDPKAMPWHHRLIGNPILSKIGRLFFQSTVRDFHCGLRGFRREAFMMLDLRTTGMEFASEMVVKSSLYRLKITEIPITLFPTDENRRSHLRSFRDGWRHLQFLLVYSPRWLFLYPGIFLMFIGGFLGMWDISNTLDEFLEMKLMFVASASVLIGFQAVIFAVLSKTFAVHERLIPTNAIIEQFFNKITPNRSLIIGLLFFIIGLGGLIIYFLMKDNDSFSINIILQHYKIIVIFVTILIIGFQLMFSSFFYSILKLENK